MASRKRKPPASKPVESGQEQAKKPSKRDGRGRFRKGASGNPAGRPPGTPHVATRLRALLDDQAEELLETAVSKAKAGDVATLRALLALAIPPRRSVPVVVELPPVETIKDALAASAALLAAVSKGEVTPDEAEGLQRLLEAHVVMTGAATLAERVEELERRLAERGERR